MPYFSRRIAIKILKVKMALFEGWLDIDQWYALTKEVGWVNYHFWLDPTSQTIAKSLFPNFWRKRSFKLFSKWNKKDFDIWIPKIQFHAVFAFAKGKVLIDQCTTVYQFLRWERGGLGRVKIIDWEVHWHSWLKFAVFMVIETLTFQKGIWEFHCIIMTHLPNS